MMSERARIKENKKVKEKLYADNIEHKFIFKLFDNRPWWMPKWLLSKFLDAVYSKQLETETKNVKV